MQLFLQRIAIERHLKSKSRLPVTLKFRRDLCCYLFKDKGDFRDGWHILDKKAFPLNHFPEFWPCLADSHDQRLKVMFPMKVRSFISWSSKKYVIRKDHNPLPKAFQEKLSFTFIKAALGDSS